MASWKGEEGQAPGPSIPSFGAGRGLVPPTRSQVKGRLPGLDLETRKTGDSPGSPLLPALPRRPGGPGQEKKDRLIEKGSQQAWAQPAHPTLTPRGIAHPLPCHSCAPPPSPSSLQSFTSHSRLPETESLEIHRQKSWPPRNWICEKHKAEAGSPFMQIMMNTFYYFPR